MRTGKNWNILKRGLKWTIGIMAGSGYLYLRKCRHEGL